MEEDVGGDDAGSAKILGSQDTSSSSICSTTRDLRLDDWITYQHDQIQRNADILKDDLETIRKRCMVPDFPNLVKENKRSMNLTKSIVNLFQGAIQKHVDVLLKLSSDMSSDFYDRFPSATAGTQLLPALLLPAVSPSSSPELGGKTFAAGAKSDKSALEIKTIRNDNQLSPVLVRRNLTFAMETATPIEAAPENDNVPIGDEADAGAGRGNDSDCSNSSALSGATVLLQRTTSQTLAKKTFSPVKVNIEKEKKKKKTLSLDDELLDVGMPLPDSTLQTETAVEKEKKKKKTLSHSLDELLDVDMPFPDYTLQTKTAEEKETGNDHQGQPDIGTELSTEAQNDLSVTSGLRCPKLAQITKVIIHKLPRNALEKLTQKKGRIVSNDLDELEKAMARFLKYNPIRKPVLNGKKKTGKSRRSHPTEKNTESLDEADGEDSSDDDNSTELDDEETSLMQIPNGGLIELDQEEDIEQFSDMDDLSAESGAEEQVAVKKKESVTSFPTKKSAKKCITPRMPLLSSDEEDLLGLTSKKRGKKDNVDSDGGEKLPKNKKKSLTDATDENNTDEADMDTGGKVKKESKATGGSDSDSDSDFNHFKTKRVQKKPEKQRVESDDDSDFNPGAMKRLVSRNQSRRQSETEEISSSDDESDSKSKSKRKKLKKKRSLSTSESDDSTKRTKKRRRIKKEKSDSEVNDSDVMIVESDKDAAKAPTSSPNGRKGMRKVMSKKELQKTTRQAGKEEEDRKRRVAENQKLYNQLFSTQLEKGEKVTELVLDYDKTSKEPLLSVDPTIVKALKPHQVSGIKFMWETCYESIESVQKNQGGGGCILAHCMGLGKTLQTIGFLHTVMNNEACKTRCALVICPLNTVGNWYNEFQQWCVDCDARPRVHKLWDAKGKRRFEALSDWQRLGGVAIIHYDAFRMLASIDEKKKGRPTQKELKIVETCLLNPGPDIVICDEGHLLKNASTEQSQTVLKLRTPRRIVLTGTPLQNNLMEYHTMMSFVKPNLLGTPKEFRNRFGNPIDAGRNKSSDEGQVRLMKRRAHVLHKLLDGCVQRLDYSVLTPYLPPKFEYAISINLSQLQKELYQLFLDNRPSKKGGITLLPDYQALAKVWTHPVILTYKRRSQITTSESETGSIKDFICDDETTDSDTSEPEADKNGSDVEIIEKDADKVEEIPVVPSPGDWFSSILNSREDLENNIELSGKILVLFEILKTCALIDDKVLVFSQFLTSLDLIEEFLAQLDLEAQMKAKDEPVTFPPSANQNQGRWRPNIEYYRIDGSTKTEDRQKSCKIFNQDKASRAKLFLISTKAGGLGINLTGANRVVIFDASWNPSHDMQSIFRVYRFGQTKPCYIYRLLARGTMEEKIYNRQVVKLSLSCRVVDEQQIERHFQYDDPEAMYDFNPNDETERPIPTVPKDRLLADLLISHKDWIFSYLEHDSLLENKEEEELTDEERRAAWEEYNNEEKPKLSYGQDVWTAAVMNNLKLRHPEKTELELYQITVKTRRDFEHMEQLVAGAQSAVTQDTKEIFSRALAAKAAELKLIFGDEMDWNNIIQVHRAQQQQQTRPPKPPQPRRQRPSPNTMSANDTNNIAQQLLGPPPAMRRINYANFLTPPPQHPPPAMGRSDYANYLRSDYANYLTQPRQHPPPAMGRSDYANYLRQHPPPAMDDINGANYPAQPQPSGSSTFNTVRDPLRTD